eukprot:CAMPEP_0194512656 /NCGR_PEP_ID=MMETSP0253-20130528/44719_1 /TAXON_ID=2966 /ORGANISM="Noctiluca scintillans" /LENGTH=42 /DNA_ID= /DNA_START= /DNA_END= /DNA_ORIENTATION=
MTSADRHKKLKAANNNTEGLQMAMKSDVLHKGSQAVFLDNMI